MAKQVTQWRKQGRTVASGDYDGATIDYDSSTQRYAGNGETPASVIKRATSWDKRLKNATRFIKNPASNENDRIFNDDKAYNGGCGIRIYVYAPATTNSVEIDNLVINGIVYDYDDTVLYAGSLCTYNFASFSLGASSVATGLNASDLANTGGLTTFNTANGLGYPNEPVLTIAPKSGATTPSTAVSTGSFFDLLIYPQVGYKLSLTSIDLQAARGGGATPRGFVVRTTTDNYASSQYEQVLSTQRPTFTSYSNALAGSGLALNYDGIVVGEPHSTDKKPTAWSKQ